MEGGSLGQPQQYDKNISALRWFDKNILSSGGWRTRGRQPSEGSGSGSCNELRNDSSRTVAPRTPHCCFVLHDLNVEDDRNPILDARFCTKNYSVLLHVSTHSAGSTPSCPVAKKCPVRRVPYIHDHHPRSVRSLPPNPHAHSPLLAAAKHRGGDDREAAAAQHRQPRLLISPPRLPVHLLVSSPGGVPPWCKH